MSGGIIPHQFEGQKTGRFYEETGITMKFEQTCITAAIIIKELADFKTHSYRQLAEATEVSERTVARYIKAFRLGGYPIKSVFHGEKRGICLDPRYVSRGKAVILRYEYGASDEE